MTTRLSVQFNALDGSAGCSGSIIELLRDRRHTEWKVRMEKAETSFLDELACAKAARTVREDKP